MFEFDRPARVFRATQAWCLCASLLGFSGQLAATELGSSRPLTLERNVGQWPSPARYLSRGRGFDFEINDHGWALAAGGSRLTMSLAGPGCAQLDSLEPASTHVNYLIGNDRSRWHVDVPTTSKVRCSQVSPGLDLVYYPHGQDLEYDLIRSPGTQRADLRFRLDGARSLRVDAQGDLLIGLKEGSLRLKRPSAYQGSSHVAARYVVTGNHDVRISLGTYDERQRLVVDPVLSLSTYLGGEANDWGRAIATDGDGNIYAAGSTYSQRFPVKNAFQPQPPSSAANAFVAKLDPTGRQLIWSTYLGGSVDAAANGLALDRHGNVYVAGATSSSDFPVTPGAFQTQLLSPQETAGFLTKLSPNGSALVYSTFLGGEAYSQITALAVDDRGIASVAGFTSDERFPMRNPVDSNLRGLFNAFVARVNAAGSDLIFSTYLGGTFADFAHAAAVDSAGNTVVVGDTTSSDFPTRNASQRWIPSGPLFRSSDGGKSWSAKSAIFPATVPTDAIAFTPPATVQSIAIDPLQPHTIYAGTWRGLFKSTDRGERWVPTLSKYIIPALCIDPVSPDTLYASATTWSTGLLPGSVYKSTDGGETWIDAGKGLAPGLVVLLRIDPYNPANLYAVLLDQGRTLLFRTTNGATTWTAVANGLPANGAILDLAISPSDPSLLFATAQFFQGSGVAGDIYVSRDRGARWSPTGFTPGPPYPGSPTVYPLVLDVDPQNPAHIMTGTSNGLYESTDGAATWHPSGEGMGQSPVNVVRFDPVNPARIWATNQFAGNSRPDLPDALGQLWLTEDAGVNWTPQRLEASPALALAIDPMDGRFIYVGTAVGPSAWVAKLAPSGELIYSSFLGGSNAQVARGVAADRAGNTYVTGYTYSSDFPVSEAALQDRLSIGKKSDAFVSKFSASGALEYSTYLGGQGWDYGNAIIASDDGRAYVAGGTSSGGSFPLIDPIQQAPPHSWDPVGLQPPPPPPASSVAATPNTFQLPWLHPGARPVPTARWLGGRRVNAVGLDTGAPGYSDVNDVFVSELSPEGTRLRFSTVLNGNDQLGLSEAASLALGRHGELYVGGTTNAHDFPTTPGALSSQLDLGYNPPPFFNLSLDMFLTELTEGGWPRIGLAGLLNDASRQSQAFLAQGQLLTVVTGRGEGDERPGQIQVMINGKPAPLIRVSEGSVTAQVPFDSPLDRQANLQVQVGEHRSNTLLVLVENAFPGIYTADHSGGGQAVAFNEDGSANSANIPAPRGSLISVRLTGGGVPNTTPVFAAIGQQPAAVISFGPAPGQPSGVDQITLRIAADSAVGGAVPLWMMVNNISAQGVTVAVK